METNKLIWILLFLIPASITGCDRSRMEDVKKTSSPQNIYQVELTNNSLTPRPSFGVSLVKLNVRKNGQEYLNEIVLDENEYLHDEWYKNHPDNIWVAENVLRFGWQKDFTDSDPDLIYINNNSKKAIKYLRLSAGDDFLVCDIPETTCITLKSGRQKWLSWLTIKGEFQNGQIIPAHGVNFFHQDKIAKPIRYCITVTDTKADIASSDLTGFYYKDITVPIVKDCGCNNNVVDN